MSCLVGSRESYPLGSWERTPAPSGRCWKPEPSPGRCPSPVAAGATGPPWRRGCSKLAGRPLDVSLTLRPGGGRSTCWPGEKRPRGGAEGCCARGGRRCTTAALSGDACTERTHSHLLHYQILKFFKNQSFGGI
ncbi:uncharacterized protein LOC144576520 [Callithrix jacchus]